MEVCACGREFHSREWLNHHMDCCAVAIRALDLDWETVKKEADEYYAKHPEAKARVDASFTRWWGEIMELPPCECGLDDVTPETCPMHKALAKRLAQ